MHLEKLSLRNFRNYETLELSFSPETNLIVGLNAQGKTNLLEAIGFLGTGRGFRAQRAAEMVRFDAEFAEVCGTVFSQERQQVIQWFLFPDARQRRLTCNGVKKRSAAQIAGIFPSVLFCPEDLMILKAGAAARRKFADAALCQLRPNYEAALAEYTRILEQKSRILRDRVDNPALLQILPEYNERLCQVGAVLISYRARFFDALGKAARGFHAAFSGGAEEFALHYKTVSTVTDPFAPVAVLCGQIEAHLSAHSRAEMEAAQCLTGPHKDDFDVTLSGLSLKTYGSQGQIRTAAVSLKLAQRELMERETGQTPVLLLDDVLSELDAARQDFLLNRISGAQVFITSCEAGSITRIGKTVEIRGGSVVE